MVRKAAVLLNHKLGEEQIRELRQRWNVTDLVFPGSELSELWESVPPVGDISIPLFNKITAWLDTVTTLYDYVIIQGDYGMVCLLVQWCFRNHRIPLYATSYRKAVETREGESIMTQRTFRHVNFRKYPKLTKEST